MEHEVETYLPAATYADLIDALTAIVHDRQPLTDLESAIKLALGELGGIWPVSVREETLRAGVALHTSPAL